MSKQQRTSLANYLKVSDRHQICVPVHSAFFPLLSQTRAMHQPNLFYVLLLLSLEVTLLSSSLLLAFYNTLPKYFSTSCPFFSLTVCTYPIVQLPRKKNSKSSYFQDHIPASAHLLALSARRWLVGALGSPVLSRFGLC